MAHIGNINIEYMRIVYIKHAHPLAFSPEIAGDASPRNEGHVKRKVPKGRKEFIPFVPFGTSP